MNKIIVVVCCLFSIMSLSAQKKAVTETGDEVVLFDNGTWEYQNKEILVEMEIPTNTKVFEKDKKSTFLLKSKKVNVGFWLNPKKWKFNKGKDNLESEYEFELKGEDLYGMVISEKVEIPLETLRSIALENGKEAAPDLKVVNEEYRFVNGMKVLLLEMSGTMQGIKFSYYGYYFSSENGTVQFITYTSQNLLESYKEECNIFLNGLVEL
ncbi:hypothetical protein ACFQ5N_06165 [Lutibacter holmesii]|uniref:DUF3157 family protein n=1 Tax=Lutibacter holmesii TaxID=1137985 RepID=A0ABW3WP03_9FLAO